MKPFQAQTHYEVLEVSVGASSAEIRGAHERLVRLYAEDQAALYGLVDPAHSEALRTRLAEAVEVLADDELRELYDSEIGLPPRVVKVAVSAHAPVLALVAPRAPRPNPLPKGEGVRAATGFGSFSYVTPSAPVPPPSQPASYTYAVVPPTKPVEPAPPPLPAPVVEAPTPVVVAAPEPPPPAPLPEVPPLPILGDDMQVAIVSARATPSRDFRLEQRPRPYEIPQGVEINGDLLKQVRMAKGLSLVQVADRTRIGVKHLENVEGDRYDALPAAVYLRGILMNLARELGLDGLRVSRSYLTFVEAHRSKG